MFRQLEAIREACTERLLVHADRDVRFSISVGGYRFTSSGTIGTPEENEKAISVLFHRADSALYMSKEAGRNRVTLWSPDCPFSSSEGRWKDQPLRVMVVRPVGAGNRTVRKACRAGEGTLKAPVWGGKAGYVTPITANHTISDKMGHPV